MEREWNLWVITNTWQQQILLWVSRCPGSIIREAGQSYCCNGWIYHLLFLRWLRPCATERLAVFFLAKSVNIKSKWPHEGMDKVQRQEFCNFCPVFSLCLCSAKQWPVLTACCYNWDTCCSRPKLRLLSWPGCTFILSLCSLFQLGCPSNVLSALCKFNWLSLAALQRVSC